MYGYHTGGVATGAGIRCRSRARNRSMRRPMRAVRIVARGKRAVLGRRDAGAMACSAARSTSGQVDAREISTVVATGGRAHEIRRQRVRGRDVRVLLHEETGHLVNLDVSGRINGPELE